MMFGVKPDVHHIRKFGSLAYVHVPVTPGRRKHHANAKLGYVLGYAEDVVGCKVFFPDERTAKFVPDLRVAEDVMYRDRYDVLPEDSDLESLEFKPSSDSMDESNSSERTETLVLNSSRPEMNQSENTVAASVLDETMNLQSMELEGGNVCAATEHGGPGSVADDEDGDFAVEVSGGATTADIGGVTAAMPSEVFEGKADLETGIADSAERAVSIEQAIDMAESLRSELLQLMQSREPGSRRSSTPVPTSLASCDGSESVAAACGSIMEQDLGGEDERMDTEVDDLKGEAAVSVADEDDSGQSETEYILTPTEVVDASALMPPRQTGKRSQRDETRSEEARVEREAEKPEASGSKQLSHPRQEGRPIRASDVKIPRNHRETLRSKYANFFLMAELEEMAALKAKSVIQEIDSSEMPEDAKPIRTGWVYSTKSDHQGYVIRFKARIVAFGNHQRPGIDFRETFSPVARMSSFRMLVALAAALGLDLYGGDINTAYLNAVLKIRQYLQSIDGFPCEIDGHVYVVLKALYGLRQSGREWNSELNQWLLDRGYLRSLTEPCLYYRFEGNTIMLVLIYVDDILVATNDEESKKALFNDLDKAYGIKDQGLLTDYLGVEVYQTAEQITIRQSKYAREILERFGYGNAHSVGNPMEVNARLVPSTDGEESDTSFPYREAIGMLMYLATSTRPDLAYALGQLSRFVANPTSKHVGAVKRVLRYLAGTLDYGITYERQHNAARTVVLEGYCDSDWANDAETRKSTTGFVFTLAGGAISWMSRRQSIVALSTAEAEYVAACEATMEAVAESNILQEILPKRAVKLRIGIDNQAAHTMATNPTYSRRTRHIELRWHYVREQVEKGAVKMHKVKGDVNPADTFTKPLDKRRLKTLLDQVGVGDAE
ncbi:hypothetical protein PR001_g13989 [Phytophthora rubi]|uniref:Uncharacterized protein n=2 Tax=Phytophthora rubi TaxID=129364 RepID=A0A6A3LHP6_9STRA|nr:hypothetical protein PR001_g13989 [Phytophthora rubi]